MQLSPLSKIAFLSDYVIYDNIPWWAEQKIDWDMKRKKNFIFEWERKKAHTKNAALPWKVVSLNWWWREAGSVEEMPLSEYTNNVVVQNFSAFGWDWYLLVFRWKSLLVVSQWVGHNLEWLRRMLFDNWRWRELRSERTNDERSGVAAAAANENPEKPIYNPSLSKIDSWFIIWISHRNFFLMTFMCIFWRVSGLNCALSNFIKSQFG